MNDYTCDHCGEPFTQEEWDNRETDHSLDCPNHPDNPDWDEDIFIECECDFNYHAYCWGSV